MRSTYITSEKLFDKASKIANLYGFSPANVILQNNKAGKRIKIPSPKIAQDRNLHALSRVLQTCLENSLQASEEPLFLFHSNIDTETKTVATSSKKPSDAYFMLTTIGIEQPYAEALLLSCMSHIFRELKSKEYTIRINSMGTKNDSKEYFSKLGKTLKKVQQNIRPECKRLLEKSLLVEAHPLLHDEGHIGVAEYITPTLRLLSDSARIHFEEVIEYLEAHSLPYELAPDLIELTKYGVHSIFEISAEDSHLHARGGRYDSLSQHLYRRKLPVASVSITLPEKTIGNYASPIQQKKPKMFFFHAGGKARISSLSVLSKLCDANIPVAHRLHHTSVSEQFDEKARQYPYTIIFGQEEAENGVLCIRKSDTRASSVIQIDDRLRFGIKDFLKS